MLSVLDFLIKLTLLLGFAYGSWLLFGRMASDYIRDVIRIRRVMKTIKPLKTNHPDNSVIRHLHLVLSVVLKKEVQQEPYIFLGGSILIFAISFLLLITIESLLAALAFSALLSIIPYIVVQAQLRGIRIDGSYDGVGLVTNLINNYKQNFFNMLEAIDFTAASKSITQFSRSNLLRLSMKLKSYRSEDELDEAIRAFVYAYDTEWSILLGMNIKIAVLDGTDVSVSLDDILMELRNAAESIEANKRFNNESFTMVKFVLIPLYFLTAYFCISFLGFSLEKFLRYQFLTDIGLKSFIITVSSIVFCYVLMVLARKPKYDI